MATEGIQRGHMSLHARNLAVAALGGADALATLKPHGEGSRRLEAITSHLVGGGDGGVTAARAREFAKKQGWAASGSHDL